MYLYFCHLLGIEPNGKRPMFRAVSTPWQVRQAQYDFRRINEKTALLVVNRIGTEEELQDFRGQCEGSLRQLQSEREFYRHRFVASDDEEEKERAREEFQKRTKAIREQRKISNSSTRSRWNQRLWNSSCRPWIRNRNETEKRMSHLPINITMNPSGNGASRSEPPRNAKQKTSGNAGRSDVLTYQITAGGIPPVIIQFDPGDPAQDPEHFAVLLADLYQTVLYTDQRLRQQQKDQVLRKKWIRNSVLS